MKKVQLTIGKKLTFVVALIIIVSMTITGLASYNLVTKNMDSTMSKNMETSAKDKADLLSDRIKTSKDNVVIISKDTIIKNGNDADKLEFLKTNCDRYKFLKLGITGEDGNVTYNDSSKASIVSYAAFTNTIQKQKVSISSPVMDDTLKKDVIVICAPIMSDIGRIQGAVVGVIDAQFVTDITKEQVIGKTGYCFVLDESGNYVANKDTKLLSKNVFDLCGDKSNKKDLKSLATVMVSGKEGYKVINDGGKVMCVAFSPIKDADWYFGITAPRAEIFASSDMMAKQIVLYTIGFIILAIILVMTITKLMISKPIKSTCAMIKELSLGHLDVRLKVKSNDEIGIIGRSLNSFADFLEGDVLGTLKQMASGNMSQNLTLKDPGDQITPQLINTVNTVNDITAQTERIIKAAKGGNLAERVDASEYEGSWNDLADDINSLMDSVAKPINEVRTVVKRMAVNDFTMPVSGDYNGVFKNLAEDVNDVRTRLLDIEDVMKKVAEGDLSRYSEFENAGVRSEKDSLTPAVITMMKNIDELSAEVTELSQESVNGNVFNARGDAEKFSGRYSDIVLGFNSVLDAVSKPMIEIRSVLKAMSVNDFSKSVSKDYKGDYLSMVESLDMVEENLKMMQNLAVKISKGDISELDKFRKIGKRSDNDMLIPAFTSMMESLKKLIDSVREIADAASDGDLSKRGNPEEFSGEYVGIVESINAFLDAVSKPISEVTRVMTSIADANFDVKIDGNFKGEFEKLISAVNATAAYLRTVVSKISDIMLKISEGDLAIDRLDSYNGDFVVISLAINKIADSFNDLIGTIKTAAVQVEENSRELSSESQELSSGAGSQASSVEQLKESISKISAKTGKNAENAQKANDFAQSTRNDAMNGNARMQEMLKSIEDINVSSHDISKIVKVIDDIAFQTKILSINASVEAAHAGEYGKGFAVVASEVGTLAQKSAKAAKETTVLIEKTMQKVESGTKTANETAEALSNIVTHADGVASLVDSIAQSSKEQADGIKEIDRGIEEVTKVVGANSNTAQASAAASEELSSQAVQLKQLIGSFRLRQNKKAEEKKDKAEKAPAPKPEKKPAPAKLEVKKPIPHKPITHNPIHQPIMPKNPIHQDKSETAAATKVVGENEPISKYGI